MDELLYEVRINIGVLKDPQAAKVRDEAVKRLSALEDWMQKRGVDCRWIPFTED